MPTTISKATVRKRAGTPAPSTTPTSTEPAIVGRKPGQSETFSGVFFGPPKTGKTTAACSGQDTLLLQFDPAGDSTKTLQGREDITVVEPQSFAEMESIVRALRTTDAGRFKYAVVDSITFMFSQFDNGEIARTYLANKNIMRPYGKAGAAVSQIIIDLIRTPGLNVLFTAHLQKEDGDESSVAQETVMGEHEVRLAVTPMVWKTLGPAVSFIGRTYKKTEYVEAGKGQPRQKKTMYYVSFNDGDRSPAGSRIAIPGEAEITPTLLQELVNDTKEV